MSRFVRIGDCDVLISEIRDIHVDRDFVGVNRFIDISVDNYGYQFSQRCGSFIEAEKFADSIKDLVENYVDPIAAHLFEIVNLLHNRQ